MLKNKYSATYKSFIKKTVFYIDTGNSPGKITPTEADLRGGGVEEGGVGALDSCAIPIFWNHFEELVTDH